MAFALSEVEDILGTAQEDRPNADPADRRALKTPDRLDSWKEISAYLKRDVRTLQRWEANESLPVHRLPHARQGTVFAFKSELDAWWLNRAQRSFPAPEQAESGESEQPRPRLSELPLDMADRAATPRKFVRMVILAGLALVAGLAAIFVLWQKTRARTETSVLELRQGDNSLIAETPEKKVAWTYGFSSQLGTLVHGYTLPVRGASIGRGEMIAWFRSSLDPENHSDFVLCFSNSGKLLWRHDLAETLQFHGSTYGPNWRVLSAFATSSNGQDEIGLIVSHTYWWPSEVQLLDLQGRLVGQFVSSGWIRSVDAFDSSAGPVLLARGFSNSRNSWFLAILDPSHISGTSPEDAGTEFQCTNCPQGSPLKYFVFPHSEISNVLGPRFNNWGEVTHTTSGFGVVVCEGLYGNNRAESDYEFSTDLELESARFTGTYWDVYDQLVTAGILKQPRAQSPERNRPASVRRWTPSSGWTTISVNTPTH
jgi:hypothetical protein